MNEFKVVSKVVGDIAILYPTGYFNNIVGEKLENKCKEHMDNGIAKIVLNFDNTELFNSIGISVLIGILNYVKESEKRICFSNLSKLHDDTFEMLGLKKHMCVFGTEEEALRHLTEESP